MLKIRHLRKAYGIKYMAVSAYGRARAEGRATMPLLFDAWVELNWITYLAPIAPTGAAGDLLAYAAERATHAVSATCANTDAAILHQSEVDPLQVAYLASPAKLMRILPDTHPTRPGQRDALYTRTTPGKALRALCPDMSDEDIKTAANAWLAKVRGTQYTLHTLDNDAPEWAADPEGLQDEWYQLYKLIAVDYSCMRGSHGPRAYGLPGNGLGLAYITDGDGAIRVRTIIHKHGDETHFHRVFPEGDLDLDKAKAFFKSQGWIENQDLDGFRLALVDHPDGGYCCPYIDGKTQRVDERGGYMLITQDADHEATNTTGRWEDDEDEPYCICDCCGDDIYDEEDAIWIEAEDRTVCRHCAENHYVLAYVNRRDQEYILENRAIYCEGTGDYYADDETAARHDVYLCEEDGNYYPLDDLTSTSRGFIHSGNWCLVKLYQEDPEGNAYAHREDTTTILHPLTGEERTYHEDDKNGIAEWGDEIEADRDDAEAEAEAEAEKAEKAEAEKAEAEKVEEVTA